MTVMSMKIGARSVCDKLEDSQSHLVQSSVHWHLRDSVTVPTNETLFPNGDNVVLGLNGAKKLADMKSIKEVKVAPFDC